MHVCAPKIVCHHICCTFSGQTIREIVTTTSRRLNVLIEYVISQSLYPITKTPALKNIN